MSDSEIDRKNWTQIKAYMEGRQWALRDPSEVLRRAVQRARTKPHADRIRWFDEGNGWDKP